MNVLELQEIFKEQIDAGLTVAPLLMTSREIANKSIIEEDEIFDSQGVSADSLSTEEKNSIYTVRMYIDLSNLEEMANDALFDTEFVKMNGSEPVFTPTTDRREAIQSLMNVFKDQIDQGLDSVTIMVEDEFFTNEAGEKRANIRFKKVDLSDLGIVARDLSGLTYKRTQNDLLVFGK